MKITSSQALVVNAPQFFDDPEFQTWLMDGTRKFTWHQGIKPDEWSDTIVLVDPSLNGEGTDSEMPEHIWDQIVEICKKHFAPTRESSHIMVRLTNIK